MTSGATGGAGGASGGGGGPLLSDRELKVIERDYPDGVTSVQIVELFTQRGIRFSEATFRKYVQQGLLPRSRRVGRKGKHQGSLGMYPSSAVRRINAIKRLMADNFTIEDIQREFLRYRDEIETLERTFGAVLTGFEQDLGAPRFDAQARRGLKRDIDEARRTAEDLVRRIESIERRLAGPRDRPAGAGGPEGAEDLL
jgi:DNA-binding transcriptional MerR regulator